MSDDPEFFGCFPIRTDIEVLPADKPTTLKLHDQVIITSRGKTRRKTKGLGWSVQEVIGVAVVNIRGVKAGSKSVIIGK